MRWTIAIITCAIIIVLVVVITAIHFFTRSLKPASRLPRSTRIFSFPNFLDKESEEFKRLQRMKSHVRLGPLPKNYFKASESALWIMNEDMPLPSPWDKLRPLLRSIEKKAISTGLTTPRKGYKRYFVCNLLLVPPDSPTPIIDQINKGKDVIYHRDYTPPGLSVQPHIDDTLVTLFGIKMLEPDGYYKLFQLHNKLSKERDLRVTTGRNFFHIRKPTVREPIPLASLSDALCGDVLADAVCVLYIEFPEDGTGGELQVYNGPINKNGIGYISVGDHHKPIPGTLVVFPGDHVHSIRSFCSPSGGKRYGIVLEVYNLREDVADVLAPIYREPNVQFHLPETARLFPIVGLPKMEEIQSLKMKMKMT